MFLDELPGDATEALDLSASAGGTQRAIDAWRSGGPAAEQGWADAGVASGLINTSQQIGGAIGVAAATTIATTFSTHYVHAHPGVSALSGGALTHGFQITFYVLAGVAAAGAVLAAALTESRAVTVAAAERVEAEVALEAA